MELLNTVRLFLVVTVWPLYKCHRLRMALQSVETLISHSSGEWINSICHAPVSKQDAQGVGSAITYLRRYSLAAMCGIAQEDDDANSAVGRATTTSATKTTG